MVYWLSSNLAAFYHLLYFHQNYSPTSQLTHKIAEKQLSDIFPFLPRTTMTLSFNDQVNQSETVLWKKHSTKINQTCRLDRNISHTAFDFHHWISSSLIKVEIYFVKVIRHKSSEMPTRAAISLFITITCFFSQLHIHLKLLKKMIFKKFYLFYI